MIGSLQGVVAAVGEDTALIEVNGVGYVVQAGARTLGRLSVGATTRLAIETHVREDAIRLFGFDSDEERAWFAHLQTIPGVGAKVALGILDDLGGLAVHDRDAAVGGSQIDTDNFSHYYPIPRICVTPLGAPPIMRQGSSAAR